MFVKYIFFISLLQCILVVVWVHMNTFETDYLARIQMAHFQFGMYIPTNLHHRKYNIDVLYQLVMNNEDTMSF